MKLKQGWIEIELIKQGSFSGLTHINGLAKILDMNPSPRFDEFDRHIGDGENHTGENVIFKDSFIEAGYKIFINESQVIAYQDEE